MREALEFSALLRQPSDVPRQEKLSYVNTIIDLLEMQDIEHSLIGKVGAGLSIEQRKRLTIGVELVSKPKILIFLDEPTSGLDGQAAFNTVRFLKKLANAGQAILVTIHQPSASLFSQFDTLLLLAKVSCQLRLLRFAFANYIFQGRQNRVFRRDRRSVSYHQGLFCSPRRPLSTRNKPSGTYD